MESSHDETWRENVAAARIEPDIAARPGERDSQRPVWRQDMPSKTL